MDRTNANTDAIAKLRPESCPGASKIIVKPMIPRAAPADMLLIFKERESKSETLFTRPVLSLRNMTGFFVALMEFGL